MHWRIEQDPRTRGTRLAESLALYGKAAETHPTPSIYHHLALAYARPGPTRDLQKAISNARLAVEGESSEVRHWHVLGLLLTATGDWRAAQGVFDIGAGVSEVDLAEEGDDAVPDTANGVVAHDYASQSQAPRVNGNGNAGAYTNGDSPGDASTSSSPGPPVTLLDRDAQSIPSSATLLRPIGDRPPASRNEAFEHALQLRMSQLTLTEYVEGPEGAGDRWVEVFQWFSERRELGADDSTYLTFSLRTGDCNQLSYQEGCPSTAELTSRCSLRLPPLRRLRYQRPAPVAGRCTSGPLSIRRRYPCQTRLYPLPSPLRLQAYHRRRPTTTASLTKRSTRSAHRPSTTLVVICLEGRKCARPSSGTCTKGKLASPKT